MSDFSSKTPNDNSSYNPHMFNPKSSGTGAGKGRYMNPLDRPVFNSSLVQMKGKKARAENMSQLTHLTFGSPFVQKQLKVGSSSDPLEKEADAVADKVMRMPAGDKNTVQRQEAVPEEEDLPISRKEKSGGEATIAPETQAKIESARGGGQALPASERNFFEPRFGRDFGDVRYHTDSNAAEAAQDINARAFTIGNDVFFNAGEYKPGTGGGRFLMAHELTHTVQQGGGVQRVVRREQLGNKNKLRADINQAVLKKFSILRKNAMMAFLYSTRNISAFLARTGPSSHVKFTKKSKKFLIHKFSEHSVKETIKKKSTDAIAKHMQITIKKSIRKGLIKKISTAMGVALLGTGLMTAAPGFIIGLLVTIFVSLIMGGLWSLGESYKKSLRAMIERERLDKLNASLTEKYKNDLLNVTNALDEDQSEKIALSDSTNSVDLLSKLKTWAETPTPTFPLSTKDLTLRNELLREWVLQNAGTTKTAALSRDQGPFLKTIKELRDTSKLPIPHKGQTLYDTTALLNIPDLFSYQTALQWAQLNISDQMIDKYRSLVKSKMIDFSGRKDDFQAKNILKYFRKNRVELVGGISNIRSFLNMLISSNDNLRPFKIPMAKALVDKKYTLIGRPILGLQNGSVYLARWSFRLMFKSSVNSTSDEQSSLRSIYFIKLVNPNSISVLIKTSPGAPATQPQSPSQNFPQNIF